MLHETSIIPGPYKSITGISSNMQTIGNYMLVSNLTRPSSPLPGPQPMSGRTGIPGGSSVTVVFRK